MADKSSSKDVIVLGASFAGIQASHQLLRSLPAEYTLTLVSPSTHFYFNIASPRALASANAFGPTDETKLFHPLLPAFKNNPRFRFVQGLAVALNPETSTVVVKHVTDEDTSNGEQETLTYGHLIIATGASAAADWAPFKSALPYKITLANIKNVQERVKAASTIVISGSGPTGIETAGEIATAWPEKKVVLVSTSSGALATLRKDVGEAAANALKKIGVELRFGVKVVGEEAGVVKLSDGTTLNAELHIPAYAVSPNSGFVPRGSGMVDGAGWVVTDEYLRAKGCAQKNIWALGDVTAWGKRTAQSVDKQRPILVENVVSAVKGVDETKWKAYTHQTADTIVIPIGRKSWKGTGIIFGWRVWGWVAYLLKGRDYFIGLAAKGAEGGAK